MICIFHREPRQWLRMCWKKIFLFESEISLNLPHCFSFVICVAQNGEYRRISAIWEVSQWHMRPLVLYRQLSHKRTPSGIPMVAHVTAKPPKSLRFADIHHFEQHKWQKNSSEASLGLFRTQIEIFSFNTIASIVWAPFALSYLCRTMISMMCAVFSWGVQSCLYGLAC